VAVPQVLDLVFVDYLQIVFPLYILKLFILLSSFLDKNSRSVVTVLCGKIAVQKSNAFA